MQARTPLRRDTCTAAARLSQRSNPRVQSAASDDVRGASMKRWVRMGKHWGGRRTALLAAVLGTVACGSSKPSVVGEHELAPGEITTWAGTGKQGSNGDGLDRSETWLDQPMEMVFSDDGAALVVDWNNHCVRSVTTEGVFENVVG